MTTTMMNSSGTHSLGVNLSNVCQSLGQDIARHLVAVLVSELGRLSSCPVHRGSCVGDRASHDAADRGGQLVDVGD